MCKLLVDKSKKIVHFVDNKMWANIAQVGSKEHASSAGVCREQDRKKQKVRRHRVGQGCFEEKIYKGDGGAPGVP